MSTAWREYSVKGRCTNYAIYGVQSNGILLLSQKLLQKSSSEPASTATAADGATDKPPRPMEPYRRMLPGLKLEGEREGEGEEKEGEEEEEGCGTSLPTPRKKRLMNFKIPLINRGGQRRDQNLSVVTRRRLFDEEGEAAEACFSKRELTWYQTDFTSIFPDEVLKRPSGSSKKLYLPSQLSDISSAEDFSSGESEEEEEEWGREGESTEEAREESSG